MYVWSAVCVYAVVVSTHTCTHIHNNRKTTPKTKEKKNKKQRAPVLLAFVLGVEGWGALEEEVQIQGPELLLFLLLFVVFVEGRSHVYVRTRNEDKRMFNDDGSAPDPHPHPSTHPSWSPDLTLSPPVSGDAGR